MKISVIILGFVLIVGTAFAVDQAMEQDNYSWRYKMTVEVETPEGIVSGSAVRQMGNDLHGSPLSQNGNPGDVSGEAVVVDLGERGVLFALISHRSDIEFYDAFREIWPHGGSTPEAIKFYANLPVGTKGVLPPQVGPKLVTFTDMNDPTSVILAQVWERKGRGGFYLAEDRMEALFGEGVKLKGITLEITDEPVTWGIEKLLHWLGDVGGGYLHGGFTSKGAPLGLHGGNFTRGELK